MASPVLVWPGSSSYSTGSSGPGLGPGSRTGSELEPKPELPAPLLLLPGQKGVGWSRADAVTVGKWGVGDRGTGKQRLWGAGCRESIGCGSDSNPDPGVGSETGAAAAACPLLCT